MRFLATLLGIVMLLLPDAAQALHPEKAFHHYVRDNWSIQQGLPQISALAIAQDRQGYLWVGTQAGLARFDGVRFVGYTPDSEPHLPGIWVRALHAGRDGRLWIGTYKGLAVYDGDSFTTVAAADAARWPALDVAALGEDAAGQVWVATTAGVFRVQDGFLHHVAGSPAPAQSLLLRSDGVWVGGRGAVYRLADDRWDVVPLPGDAPTAIVNRLVETQGRVWAATAEGLFARDGGGWQRVEQVAALAHAPIDLLYPDRDGNLWAGGDAGLARIRAGQVAEYVDAASPGGIPGLRVAFEDGEGNLWLGSQWEGLTRLLDSWTRRFSRAEGLRDPIVWSVSPDPDGQRIWVGGNDGVSVMDDGRFTQVVTGSALPHPHGYNLLAEADRLWIGTRRGLAVIDHRGPRAGAVQQPALFSPLAGLQINGIVRSVSGELWIPTSEGLFRVQGGRLRRYAQQDGLADPRARFFYRAGDGRVLVGTQGGLFEMRGERFFPVGLEQGLPPGLDVTTILQLDDGRIAIGTLSERIYFSHGGRWHPLGEKQGLPANSPFFLTQYEGYLWSGGIRGIARVPIADLGPLATGALERAHGEMLLNERGDPMSGQQGFCCNGAGNAKGFRRGATLWLPSRDGVVALDIDSIVKNPVPPSVAIERVQVNDTWRAASTVRGMELPENARDLSFEFTVLSFQDPESNSLQYRLRGYDRDWLDSDNLRRNTRYTNLPPGDYVFEVRGRNNAGLRSLAPAQLPFSVKPRFQETPLFFVLLGLLLATTVFAGYRYQQHRYRLQRRALELLVQQRTEALEIANHRLEDASQTDPLTGLRNRRYMASQIPADLAYYDRQIQRGAHQGEVMVFALVDIDHFKAVNDNHGHKAGDLVLQQFAQVLSGLVRSGDYVVRWGGEEFLLVFRPMPARNLTVIGERLRTAVSSHGFDLGNGTVLHLTASAGLAEYPLFRDHRAQLGWETMVELADRALYYVKGHGRNGWAAFRPTDLTDITTLLQELQEDPQAMLAAGRLQLVSNTS
ncbi:MAG TPA: diguanylate cyclase [Lysobacter sp.]